MSTRSFYLFVAAYLGLLLIQPSAHAIESKTLYQTCAACHGAQGEGNPELAAPALAGQFEWYTQHQLENFKNTIRGYAPQDSHGQQMRALTTSLDFDKEVPQLVKYIEDMSAPKIITKNTGDMMNGSRYYQAKCGACHGGKAEGNASFKAPKLANQHPSYLFRQMKNFVSGARGSQGGDKLGKQMAMMARTVNEKELKDIIYFISQQP